MAPLLLPHIPDETRFTLLRDARSIAIIGAKDRAGHPVNDVGHYLLQAGYQVFPVHPARDRVWGLRTWKKLTDIPEPIDIVNVFRTASACPEHAKEALALPVRPRAFWMQLGIVSPEAAAMAASGGLMVLEDVCIKTEHQRLHVPRPDAAPVFVCRQCGQCCLGKGGIVVGKADRERLSARFGMSEANFLELYAEFRNGKQSLRTGPDGNCIFFHCAEGCTVHEDKPNVCRAWPFFRGNMVDEESLAMAKDFCLGIRPEATHAAFVAEGRRYLEAQGLVGSDEPGESGEPTALSGLSQKRESA